MLDDRALHIKRELQQRGPFSIAYRTLISKTSINEPNLIELTALAGVLHVLQRRENVFQTIAKRVGWADADRRLALELLH